MLKKITVLFMALALVFTVFSASMAENGDGNTIECSLENGSYVIRIPAGPDDEGWRAVETEEGSAVKLRGAEYADGAFTAVYDPAGDGEATVTLKHYYNALACDQVLTWDLAVQDGKIQDCTGGSNTMFLREDEAGFPILGEWLEADTQFTQMTVAQNENGGWDVWIASPLTHGAYVFTATMYFDCDGEIFRYNNGALYNVPITEEPEEDLGDPIAQDIAGTLIMEEYGEDGIAFHWVNEGEPAQDVVFLPLDDE